jgi:hypothetical protein
MTTRPACRLTAAAGIAALALLISSCSGQDDPVAQPTPSSTAPTSSAPTSSSIVPVSAEDQALADVTEIVNQYYARLDQVSSDRNADASILREVATGDALQGAIRNDVRSKGQGRVQIGNVKVLEIEPFSIDLTSDPTADPRKYETIVIDTCVDVSGVNVVDAEGKSVVLATRLPQSGDRFSVVHYDFGWRVTTVEYAGQPCA